MVIEYLDWTNRFEFVEEKSEIKNRMKSQWVASRKGVSQNEVYGMGKIMLAKYFVTIEIYDFSVSEDEVLSLKDGSKQTQTTRLGLQVRFTNAENGTYFVGSGLGEANTVKTQEGLLGVRFGGNKLQTISNWGNYQKSIRNGFSKNSSKND